MKRSLKGKEKEETIVIEMDDDLDRRKDDGGEPVVNGGGDNGGGDAGGGERRGRPDISNMFSIKVDNLAFRVNEDDLKDAFGTFGDLGDVYIPKVNDSSVIVCIEVT